MKLEIKDLMTLEIRSPVNNSIVFNVEGDWALKITKDGISFNTERFSEVSPDGFAKMFIDILEEEFKVKFERIKTPYHEI